MFVVKSWFGISFVEIGIGIVNGREGMGNEVTMQTF
jgi:hypothetical protein